MNLFLVHFELLPRPSAEPSGVQNSQSILCATSRPFFTLLWVAGYAYNCFATLAAPNLPHLRCMRFHYFGGNTSESNLGYKKTPPMFIGGVFLYLKPDDDLLSHGNSQTTIGDASFHVWVRDGIRWFQCSMVVRQTGWMSWLNQHFLICLAAHSIWLTIKIN